MSNSTDIILDQLTTNFKHLDGFFEKLTFHINGIIASVFFCLVGFVVMICLGNVYICCKILSDFRPKYKGNKKTKSE